MQRYNGSAFHTFRRWSHKRKSIFFRILEKRKYRSHTKWNGKEFIAKKAFETEKEAINAARYMNTQDHIIHKMVAYKCAECGKWHIGRNNTELTEEDRQHYKKLLDRKKKIGF